MYDLSPYVWSIAVCVIYRRMYDLSPSVWSIAVCMIYRRMYDLSPYVWSFAVCMIYRRMYDLSPYLWSIAVPKFHMPNLNGAFNYAADVLRVFCMILLLCDIVLRN